MNRLSAALLLVVLLISSACTQTGDLLPYDNLVVEGIPSIPAPVIDAVGRYTEFRSAAFQSWHPAKHEMLMMTRFGDTPQLHYLKFPGGARTQMTFFKDRISGAAFPPVASTYFIFSKDIGGGEWFQNYRYDLATGAITLLTDGKSRNTGGVFSNAGDKIVYGSTRRNGKDIDFYVMKPLDPTSDKMVLQLDKGEAWQPQDWAPKDDMILAMEEVSANESHLWLVNPTTGTKTLLTPKESEAVSYDGGVFSKDGKGVYATSDRNSEFKRLVEIDLGSKKETVLSGGIPWDVDEFALSRDGSKIAFITNEDGISVVHLMETGSQTMLPLPALPVGIISGLSWHEDGTTLAFNVGSARATTDIYSLEIASGKLDRWTYSETGGLVTDSFAEPRLIRWKSFDGKSISGFLYHPPASFTGKRPVIINIHGGPEGQYRPGFLGRNNYYTNELGVAMIFPNIRGSSGYGKTFLKLDNGFKREDTYKDIGALLDWIATQPDLDAGRVMVTGGSYGGHMTFAIATYFSDKIACSLPVVGISNFVTFLERTEAYRRDLRRVEYGDERDPKMRAFFEKIAPVNNADKITKPMFIVQGKNDPRVPANEAQQMVATLKKNQVPVWFLLANDEGHGFAKKKNQDYQFYATVLFMKKYLIGE